MDDFFLLFVLTRLKESGWPKRKGLRRQAVVDDGAIAQAAAEAVRVALAMGGQMRDFTMGLVAKTFDNEHETAELWFDDVAARGNDKLEALPDTYPIWRRFVSITSSPSGTGYDARETFEWNMTPGNEFMEWDSDEARLTIDQAVNVAIIALGWAFRNPTEIMGTFHDRPRKDRSQEIADAAFHLSVAQQLAKQWGQDPISGSVGGARVSPRQD